MKRYSLILTFLLFSNFVLAQDDYPKLKVFLDCASCDLTFLQQEFKYINFLRDQKHADVYILVRTQSTGNGGEEYNLEFTGQNEYQGVLNRFSFSTFPTNTRVESREAMVRNLHYGLSLFWNKFYDAHPELFPSYGEENDSLSTHKPKVEKINVTEKDPWNNWVFNVGVNGSLSGEETSNNTRGGFNFSAKKVTKKNKFFARLEYDFSRSEFTFGDTKIVNKQKSTSFNISDAVSINDHWSLGGFLDAGNSVFENYSFFVSFKPAIEYSFFTYEESIKKQITLSYRIGPLYNDYEEVTLFQEEDEFLWEHSLNLNGSVQQKWGSLSGEVSYSSFLHDSSFHAFNFHLGTNFRITNGLTFNVSGNYSITNNQINLAGGDLELEELLLRQQQVQSGYNFFVSLGVNYSFGSIFRSIVNPRFDF